MVQLTAEPSPSLGRDPWPMPPPDPLVDKGARSSRSRTRWRKAAAVREFVRFGVMALNWQTLGHPLVCPPACRSGVPRTLEQTRQVQRLREVAGSLVRLGHGPSCDLGRSLDKFRTVGEDLATLNSQVHRFAEASTGSAHLPASYKFGSGPEPEPAQSSPVRSTVAPRVCIRKVDSSRVKWDLGPSFDPLPYLDDGELRAAYLDPEVLRLPRDQWPPLPRAKVHASPQEFLQLLRKWDAVGALSLLPAASTDADERCGMFPVYKDEDFDRLILNPTVVNPRMRSISRHIKCLGQGFLLTRIQLRPDERLVISGDDLREFYYTFKVSPARARRNALAVVYDASDFSEFSCWDPALAGRRVVPALAALAMGDSLAVELAQASHLGLLQKEVGACKASELVVYRAPFPRGPFWEILAIDDHVGIQAVSASTPASARRDRQVFQKADLVYPSVGLCRHPKKKIREADNHTVVGGRDRGAHRYDRSASLAHRRAGGPHPGADPVEN